MGGIARFLVPKLSGIDASPNLSARYRALKRLAIEAHDHTRELDYFANELKALRGHRTTFCRVRSIFCARMSRGRGGPYGRRDRAERRATGSASATRHYRISAGRCCCIRKALPFAGIASSEKLNQIYACLYGVHGQAGRLAEPPDRLTPVIPDAVDYLGMVQLVLSILLLFLFPLAVRSHFRIR